MRKIGARPTDRGKRSVLIEKHGVLVGLAIAGTDISDHPLLHETLEAADVSRPDPDALELQCLRLDRKYARRPLTNPLRRVERRWP